MTNIQRFNKMCVTACVVPYVLMLIINMCAMLVVNLVGLSGSYPGGALNISAICLEIYIIATVILYRRLVMTQPRMLVNFYLAGKMLKMLVAVLILIVSLKSGVNAPVTYSAVFFLMYITSVVTDSIFYSKTEKELSNEMAK